MTAKPIQAACALTRERFAVLRMDDEAFEDQADHEILLVDGHAVPTVIARRGHNVRIARMSDDRDKIAVLSRLGGVEFFSLAGESLGHEDITGAIGKGEAVPEHGFLNSIACIGGQLFACGMGGQVYARTSVGKWELMALDLLTADRYERWFSNIQGLDQDDIFVDGLGGVLYHFKGKRWRQIDSGTDAAIGEMIFGGTDDIYIAGVRSTLLFGSAERGFRNLTIEPTDLTLYTICRFRDRIFLGTEQGLYEFDETTRQLRLNATIDHGDIVSLQVVEDVMWCFAATFVRRFDGTRWERFDNVF